VLLQITGSISHKLDMALHQSVREWSHENNQSLFDREHIAQAIHYSVEAINFRSESINLFVDDFKSDPDSALPHVQMFLGAPASSLATVFSVEHMSHQTNLFEVVATISKSQFVVINGYEDEAGVMHRDALWDQRAVLFKLIGCTDFDVSVTSILNDVPELPTLHVASSGLDEVLRTMSVHGTNVVGLVDDQGSVVSVVQYSDLFKAFIKEINSLYVERQLSNDPDVALSKSLGAILEDEDELEIDDETGGLQVRTANEAKYLKEAALGQKSVSRMQKIAQEWVENPITELLIMLLLVLDLSLTIVEIRNPKPSSLAHRDNPLMVMTGGILFVFMFEGCVRIMGYRWSLVNGTRLLDLFDVFIVVISIGVYLFTIVTDSSKIAKSITFARIIRFLRILKFGRRLRKLVGVHRRRYKKDGFDLDLTYITPSVIAMSLPSVGAEANYRNPIDDVVRFFSTYHKQQFLIFNLCAERAYDIELFGGRVERLLVEDHNPPLFDMLLQFINRAESFLDEGPHNVIAVHCKGGKGRTGVFICAWLRYSNFRDSCSESMVHFAARRTGKKAKNTQAVSGASQRRYLDYFDTALSNSGYRANKLRLVRIRLHTCPHMDTDGGCDPWITLEQSGKRVFSSLENPGPDHNASSQRGGPSSRALTSSLASLTPLNMKKTDKFRDFEVNMDLTGDVRLVLYDNDTMPPRDELTCFMWFHTGFITSASTVFEKEAIDMAWSDRKCKVFDADFKIEFIFDGVPDQKTTFGLSPSRLHPTSSKNMLGTWKIMPTPNLRTLERTKKYKGGNIQETTFRENFSIKIEGGDAEHGVLEPLEYNLCPCSGPEVSHDHVQLVSLNAAAMAGQTTNAPTNEYEKRLINYYKSGSAGGGNSALANKVRALVSLNKKRFQEDGFDLDLTYITPRIIAMGYPAATGIEGKYRNSADEVYRFFQERHSAHFRIVNLVAERGYNLDMYHGAVVRYPFMDHNAPAFELLLPCCAHMHRYLQADKDNVVAVHCKAGKGRTGLIIVCYLIFGGLYLKSVNSRKFYDSQRCHDGKGLTIISQIRYAHYFEKYLERLQKGEDCPVRESESPAVAIVAVVMHTIPRISGGGCEPSLRIGVRCEEDHEEHIVFNSSDHVTTRKLGSDDEEWWCRPADHVQRGVRVAGDIVIRVMNDTSRLGGVKTAPIFHTWLHSQFMEHPPDSMAGMSRALSTAECEQMNLPTGSFSLLMSKHEIDGAAKDVKNTHFPQSFSFEVFWHYLQGESGTGPALRIETAVAEAKKSDKGAKRECILDDKRHYLSHCQDCTKNGTAPLSYAKFILSAEGHGNFGKADVSKYLGGDVAEMPDIAFDWRATVDARKRNSLSSRSHDVTHTGAQKSHELRRAGTSLAILHHTNEKVAGLKKVLLRSNSDGVLSKMDLVTKLKETHKDELLHDRHYLRQLVDDLDQHHKEKLVSQIEPSDHFEEAGSALTHTQEVGCARLEYSMSNSGPPPRPGGARKRYIRVTGTMCFTAASIRCHFICERGVGWKLAAT